jgi:metal-dependent amidase/aminoacylase/carboxypeptidase family protein
MKALMRHPDRAIAQIVEQVAVKAQKAAAARPGCEAPIRSTAGPL